MNAAMSPRHAFGKNLIEIEFTYRGERVRGIDFRFYDGDHWSGVLSASDGLGGVEVAKGTKIEDCLIRYEVSPSYMQHIFKEVKSVETALQASDSRGKELSAKEARIILVTFLENYKTAYALKRLDYIDSIFDEDALIITGHVLKDTGRRGEFSESPYVELTRRSKREYIDRLAASIRTQTHVCLGSP